MRIQTILNRVEKFKSFVYGEARLEERDDGPALVVQMRPRKNSRPYLLRLRPPRPGVRPPGGTAVRVRAALGDRGLPGLPDAARGLQAVWGDRRDGAVVRRQEPTDDDLSLVSWRPGPSG